MQSLLYCSPARSADVHVRSMVAELSGLARLKTRAPIRTTRAPDWSADVHVRSMVAELSGLARLKTRAPILTTPALFLFAIIVLGTALTALAAQPRILRVLDLTASGGQEVTATVQLVAQGDENALGFSLSFDPVLLSYRGETPGPGATGTALNVNTNQAASGRVGFALARPVGQLFSAGTNDLLRLRFRLGLTVTNADLAFADSPVVRETVDANVNTLSMLYSNGVITVTPLIAPGIATEPVNQTVYAGTNVTLGVVAGGSLPLAYQWRWESTAVTGATNASLTLLNVATNQSGSYRVIVSNASGSVTSAPALLTVLPPLVSPTINRQPQSQVAGVGETVVFTVAVSGSPPLNYQWRFGSRTLTGETNATLFLTNLTTGQSGNYSVVVINAAGSATSASASLSVSPTPRLVRAVNRSVATGGEVDLPVELVGLGDENSVGFSLVFDPMQLIYRSASLGSNLVGVALWINTNRAASGQVGVALTRPAGDRFPAGVSQLVRVRFRAGDFAGPAGVDFGDVPIPREVADVFGAARPVVFSNGVVTVLSTGPAIVSPPQDQRVPIFGTATFTVTASGSVPLSYQWQRNGVDLPGATDATLVLAGIRPAQAGSYHVIVTNAVGAVTSSVATLTVPRLVRALSAGGATGNDIDVPLQLLANGDENAVGLSLHFDPDHLVFREVLSHSPPASATLNVNTLAAAAGSLGLALALPTGQRFGAGTQQLAVVRFNLTAQPGASDVAFGDAPVIRDLVNGAADSLEVLYQSGSVTSRLDRPLITKQPAGSQVLPGADVWLSADATGSLPILWQWQFNGTNVTGATNSSLLLSRVGLNAAGAYSVIASNVAGATNSAIALVQVLPPPADLAVFGVTPPANLTAGQPVGVSWSVTNLGTSAALGPWQETIYVSDSPDGSAPRAIGTFTFSGAVGANLGIQRTATVIMPPDLSGMKYFVVVEDSGNWLAEIQETNNLAVAASPTQVRNADLVVSALTTPHAAQLGQTLNMTWTVRNFGTAPANSTWSDRLYLSSGSNNLSDATVLLSQPAPATLAPGAGYTNTQPVTLALSSQSTPGNYFIVVAADFNNAQPEFSETNNARAVPISLTLPPLPDLAVSRVSAPPNLAPGQPFEMVWTVTNHGAVPATGAWSETILCSNIVSGAQSLTMLTFTNALDSGGFVTRTQTVFLPANGPAGDVWFLVGADSRNDVFEANEGNNFGLATNATRVPLTLQLQLPVSQIAEDAANPVIRATLTRNGDRSLPLTVTLSNSNPAHLIVPATALIVPNQSTAVFDMRVLPDGIVAGPQTVIVSVSASGFQGDSAQVTVSDADFPHLTLTLVTNRVREGQTVAATVSRDFVTPNPLPVLIESLNPNQVMAPTNVVIPAGSNSVVFVILAVEDTLVEPTLTYTVRVSASGFIGGETDVAVVDDDVGQVTLTLANAVVSENAGPQATAGTLTRDPVTTRSVTIELVSSDPTAALVAARVTIPANRASAAFDIAAVDDPLVDGPQTALIGGFILASGSNARVAEITPDTLTVTDDDGPALRLTLGQELVGEGLNPATTATVTRNTPATNALLVTLSSSDPTEATVPPTVTIPPGQSSFTFNLATAADGVTDGNQTVTISASTPGFAAAADTLVVSDADLPDLAVATITAPAAAETESHTSVSYRIANQGFAPAATNFLTRLFLSRDPVMGDDTLLSQYRFNGSLPVGQYFEQTLQILLPQTAGNYWIIVQIDPENNVAETLEDNNTAISRAPLDVEAAYQARVQTSLQTALAGTPVPMTGRATNHLGAGVPFKLVNLHIVMRGTDRVIAALTDANGNFAATFQPLANEAGSYQIFATHPGVATEAVQDTFTLLGMRASPDSVSVRILEGASVSNSVTIENLNDAPLTALSATLVSQPPDLGVTINLADTTLPGAGRVNLNYRLSAATAAGSGVVHVHLRTAEGPETDAYFVVEVEPLHPRLVAEPGELVAGMSLGKQIMLEFTVANVGGIPTGPITLSLPAAAWMQLASTNPMPSLAPGETNRVTLVLTPPANLPLGPYAGSIALNAAQAGLTVPFHFRALSEQKGDLRVEAVDEFTFYAEGAPKVANASVTVRDSFSRTVVTNGVTGTNGQFFAGQLMEGYYEIEVGATKHNSFTASRFLVAGQTNEVQAFLNRQTVQYIWKVEPTEIEDRTRITIETVFETYVPAPVVTVEPALVDLADIKADITQIDLKISNHGLIAANDFQLNMPTHPLWEFTPLLTDVGTIPARSSLTVPLTIRRLHPPASAMSVQSARTLLAAPQNSSSGPCNTAGDGCFRFDCGKYSFSICLPIAFVNTADDCRPPSLNLPIVFVPPGGGFGPGGPGGGGDGPTGVGRIDPPNVFSVKSCEECVEKFAKAALDCIISFSGAGDGYKCAYGLANIALDPSNGLGYAGTLADCFAAAGHAAPLLGQIISAISCLDSLLSACLNPPAPSGSPNAPQKAALASLRNLSPGPDAVPKSLGPVKSALPHSFAEQVPEVLARKFPGLVPLAQRVDRMAAYPALLQTVLGDEAWFNPGLGANFSVWLSAFTARVATNSVEGARISAGERSALLGMTFPEGLTETNINKFIDRWNRTRDYHAAGIFKLADVPAGQSMDFIAFDVFTNAVEAVRIAELANHAEGFTNAFESVMDADQRLRNQVSGYGDSGSGVCAQVRLVLDQQAVISREAFKATLEILNNSDTQLRDVSVEVIAVNGSGQNSTTLFGIRPPTLENLTAVDGTGLIDANTTGKAAWIIIPTSDAAPDAPTVFYVSGTLHYTQDGLLVTVPLAAVPITVHPNPRLAVKYFHQRDVYADDPFTDVVEPSIPFSLAVMVENRGKGIAKNMRITSSQPRIVENEKGLLIDFQILATEVAGQNLLPSLTVNFGAITNGQLAIGRWLLTSTLQGLFEDYKATFEHIDGLGNPKLSLIEEVTIHEMIHLVQAPGAFDDGKPDFLVNEIGDARDLPDTLYLSDGATNPVSVVEQASLDSPPSAQHLQVQLTAPILPGWAYLRVPNPGQGQFTLTRITRSDGVEISLRTNAWTTDRTFIGLGRRPINENILHLLDYNSPGAYTLFYTAPPAPDTLTPTSLVATLPANSPAVFPVQWSGQDAPGSGNIAAYDIFVSTNGSPFVLWLQHTRLTGAMFQGAFGGQYAFYSVATDQAGNRENPHVTPDALTSVTLSNQPPALVAISEQVINEGATLQLNLTGTDPDGPTSALTYQLAPGAPPGAVLNRNTGGLTWPTTEANGPSTNDLTVIVTDNGIPPQSATGLVRVIVGEINTPPVLSPIPNYTINEGIMLSCTNLARDFDLPANALRFSLGPDAPFGAGIDEFTGAFQWRPTEYQGPSTNRISVRVIDDGIPSLNATEQFTVIVRDVRSDFTLSIGSTNVFTGETNSVPIVLTSGLDLTNVTFVLAAPLSRLSHLVLQSGSAEVLSLLLQPIASNRSELNFVLDAAQRQASSRPLARLGFVALPNPSSAIVPLEPSGLTGIRVGGGVLTNSAAFNGRIIIIGNEPVLVAERAPSITLYGKPALGYMLQSATHLSNHISWLDFAQVQLTNRFAVITGINPSGPLMIYRAYQLDTGAPRLSVLGGTGPVYSFLLHGEPGTHYLIQSSTNLAEPPFWTPAYSFTLTNSVQPFNWTNAGEPRRFFRAQGQ